MGALPSVPLPRDTVLVAGEKVPVRGLSRAEVARLPSFEDDFDKLETFILARGVGTTEEEAAAWRDEVSAHVVGLLVDRIVQLSSLDEDAQKEAEGAFARGEVDTFPVLPSPGAGDDGG